MRREICENDVLVDWERDKKGPPALLAPRHKKGPVAYVYLFRDLYGVVGVGDKPGYARFAIKDGPLAQVMEVDDSKSPRKALN